MALLKIMAVLEPAAENQPCFERALDSAKITGAALHLYICVNQDCGEDNRDEIVGWHEALMGDLAKRAAEDNIEVESRVDWDSDWRTQAVLAGNKCGADLIIKHSIDHSDVDRAQRRTADWMLLREARCSVLMVKNNTRWESRRVLGAVIAKPADAAHEELNEQVTAFVNDFATSYESDAHYVTAFHDLNNPPDTSELAKRCRVDEEKVHTGHGSADEVITQTAREISADLIVIGTVGRSGIKGRVVGNTSERLLDHTHCDVLVLR